MIDSVWWPGARPRDRRLDSPDHTGLLLPCRIRAAWLSLGSRPSTRCPPRVLLSRACVPARHTRRGTSSPADSR